MDYFPRVVQAVADQDYCVYAYFDNGLVKRMDMRSMLDKGVFQPLRDIALFRDALTVLNDTVAWDLSGRRNPSDCIDIDPFTVYEQPTVEENSFWERVVS